MNMEATYLDAKRNTSTDVSLDSQGIFFKKKKNFPTQMQSIAELKVTHHLRYFEESTSRYKYKLVVPANGIRRDFTTIHVL